MLSRICPCFIFLKSLKNIGTIPVNVGKCGVMFRMSQTVLGRGESRFLFKLSHKVYVIFISALFGNKTDRHRRILEKQFSVFNPGLNDISFTGDAELFFI